MSDMDMNDALETLVDAIGDALGVDTGTVHAERYGHAKRAALAALDQFTRPRRVVASDPRRLTLEELRAAQTSEAQHALGNLRELALRMRDAADALSTIGVGPAVSADIRNSLIAAASFRAEFDALTRNIDEQLRRAEFSRAVLGTLARVDCGGGS